MVKKPKKAEFGWKTGTLIDTSQPRGWRRANAVKWHGVAPDGETYHAPLERNDKGQVNYSKKAQEQVRETNKPTVET